MDEFDGVSLNFMGALRNAMEAFSLTTRFILTCNYIEKIIEPIQSRCQCFQIIPPRKGDIAERVAEILNKESVEFESENVALLVNSHYPDIRRIINECQKFSRNGKLDIDRKKMIDSNYMLKLLEILKTETNKKECFIRIRQLVANSQVKNFQLLFKLLFDEVDIYAPGHISGTILSLAEGQYQDAFVVDKEINFMATIIKILNEIK